jgi:hypothetical protein
VTLVGFGTFSVGERAARVVRNPQTGAEIQIASKQPKFSAGSKLKDATTLKRPLLSASEWASLAAENQIRRPSGLPYADKNPKPPPVGDFGFICSVRSSRPVIPGSRSRWDVGATAYSGRVRSTIGADARP